MEKMERLHTAAHEILRMYEAGNASYLSNEDSVTAWTAALDAFEDALRSEDRKDVLEQCVLSDANWGLHVEGRMSLLKKAKMAGASSEAFLRDYFGYLAAHLDPGPEKEEAIEALKGRLQAQ